MLKPLKRHESLIPLSRDHHQGLLLCWKIREGLNRNISFDRLKNYTDYFFCSQLKPHFRFEEDEIFPLLGKDHPMHIRALKEHSRLEDLFQAEVDKQNLEDIEKELNRHIRFEERELFMELQDKLSEEDLQKIKNKDDEMITPNPDDWDDKFWLNK